MAVFVNRFAIAILQVTIPFVREAFSLLNKSIIRVEQPDINLEETEEPAEVPSDAAVATPMDVDQASPLYILFPLVNLQVFMPLRLFVPQYFLFCSIILE